MPKVTLDMSMSLDGFITGPDAGVEHPLGVGGERLHEWISDTVQQLLRAGLLDELQVHVVPVLLGAGTRLFDGLERIELEQERVIASADVTHLRFRVMR